MTRRLVPTPGSVACLPLRCQARHREGVVSRCVSSWKCSASRSGAARPFFPHHRQLGQLGQLGPRGGHGCWVVPVREGVFGPPTYPPALRQAGAEPARADRHARLLLQIDRQALGRPHVKGHPQRAGSGLQRRFHGRQVDGIRAHRSPRARGVGACSSPALSTAGQPVLHGVHRASTPAGNPLHLVTQRRRFDHLQPFTHPPREIGAPQLALHLLALLSRDRAVLATHALAPSLLLPRAPPALWLSAAYPRSTEFTSGYLA